MVTMEPGGSRGKYNMVFPVFPPSPRDVQVTTACSLANGPRSAKDVDGRTLFTYHHKDASVAGTTAVVPLPVFEAVVMEFNAHPSYTPTTQNCESQCCIALFGDEED